MYRVAIDGDGWLVDITHPATISALESAHDGTVSRFLATQGILTLSLPVLTSDNRLVTTLLAEILRDAELDDGTTPRGVHFPSKHGGYACRAIWLPYQDEMPTGLRVEDVASITVDDASLRTVAGWFGPARRSNPGTPGGQQSGATRDRAVRRRISSPFWVLAMKSECWYT